MRIALAGNPNSEKTTLFNSLTGSNQHVGNWPGVTVEQKTGYSKINKSVEIVDLPGIYSLSPYTTEEEIARNFLLDEKPDAIINIVDGTNLERNLYLTTQLLDLNIPLVLAVNMSDVIEKTGDKIDLQKLSDELSVPVVMISALKGTGLEKLTELTAQAAHEKSNAELSEEKTSSIEIAEIDKSKLKQSSLTFDKNLECVLERIAEIAFGSDQPDFKRWYQIKLFERDAEMQNHLNLDQDKIDRIDQLITEYEDLQDDDSESIITSERYSLIENIIKKCFERSNQIKLSASDKIDRIVTNRIFALPIFILVMFCVYFISISTIGTMATDFVNENIFGEGWFLFGKGRAAYDEKVEEFEISGTLIEAFEAKAEEMELEAGQAKSLTADAVFYDDTGNVNQIIKVDFSVYQEALEVAEPEPEEFGLFVPGIPDLVDNGLTKLKVSDWLHQLVVEGIVAGVGAVLGFLPQMFVLFLCLAFLERCGYMARIAFIMDRFFRKFGFSGKAFIPLMIGTGCSVPGIMAARTIENERDRRMTVITTSFIPCSAKLPVIALIAGAFFEGKWWVAAGSYFIGIMAVIISGIILKKTKMFAGDVAHFVIELPDYHFPRIRDILRSSGNRTWEFVKNAGSVVLLSSIVIWFLGAYGLEEGFGRVDNINHSILATIAGGIGWIFIPLGFGSWRPAVATITGLIAKENIVGTFGVLYNSGEVAENGWQIWDNMALDFTALAAASFLLFNLLCAPCFAAIGAIKQEMGNAKWTWFAIGYQTVLAYTTSLIFYQFGMLVQGKPNIIGVIVAAIFTAAYVYLLFRPGYEKRLLKKSKSALSKT